jgi:hypothetical protein
MSKTSRTSAAADTAAADTARSVETVEETGPALPDFQAGTLYDIQLTRNVEFPPGSQNFLRPGETHHLDGAYAEGMREFISGAVPVET